LWHIANGITGLVFFVIAPVLYMKFGIVGICAAAVAVNVLIYLPYCMIISHRAFGQSIKSFDLKYFGPGALLFGLLLFVYFMTR